MGSLAEKLGNMIFAIETNMCFLRKRIQVSDKEAIAAADSIQASLEQMKEIKKWIDTDPEPFIAPPDTMSDAERAWMEDKADGFLDSDLPHP